MEFSQEISYVVHSPTCSTQISSSTEEDDDMAANCLILLAQGGSPSRKISSRKFSEMAGAAAAKGAGLFVYECKTCNRTFPSFQALGGHRASHKKPKLIDHHHEHHNNTTSYQISTTSSPASGPGPGQGPVSNDLTSPGPGLFPASSKAKIHECSICGAEFSSGQALGGHMRRHRPPPAISATTAKAAVSVSNSNGEATEESCDDVDGEDNRRGAIFALDLNLPAPQDDEEEGGNNNKFEFSAKQQQNLVFSVPPLVDCHY